MSAGTRRIGLAVSGLMLGMLAFAAPASALTETFNFTGAAQTWNVPPGVGEATFDLLGAQGGGSPRRPVAPGGLGGRATGTIAVTPDSPIQVNVGGQGGQGDTDTGGFTGGGWETAAGSAVAVPPTFASAARRSQTVRSSRAAAGERQWSPVREHLHAGR